MIPSGVAKGSFGGSNPPLALKKIIIIIGGQTFIGLLKIYLLPL